MMVSPVAAVNRLAGTGPSAGLEEFGWQQLTFLADIASRPASDINEGWEAVDRIESLHERMEVLELKVRELEALA